MSAGACGVILAAGAGRRFGAGPKQLAPLGGKPLLQHVVDAAAAAPGLDEVVVVLGAEADAISAAIDFGRARPVRCAGWQEGIAASLRCGVEAAAGAAWIVLLLGDEPVLRAAALAAILEAARAAPPQITAVRATWEGRPGHPVAIRGAAAAAVRDLRGDEGARRLLAGPGTLAVECGHLGAMPDVDTPGDLRRLGTGD